MKLTVNSDNNLIKIVDMTEHLNNPDPLDFPGKKHEIDPVPLQPDKNEIITPGDPLQHDSGREDNDKIGDDEGDLGNAHEKPHTPTTPSAFHDGIPDGDRDAFDEISYDEEDEFPRQTP